MMKDNGRDYKKEMIDTIVSDLQKRAVEIHEDPELSVEAQLTKMNVVWNMIKLLEHYGENIKVLEDYRRKKEERRKRLMRGKNIED